MTRFFETLVLALCLHALTAFAFQVENLDNNAYDKEPERLRDYYLYETEHTTESNGKDTLSKNERGRSVRSPDDHHYFGLEDTAELSASRSPGNLLTNIASRWRYIVDFILTNIYEVWFNFQLFSRLLSLAKRTPPEDPPFRRRDKMATYQEVALMFLALLLHRDPQHFEETIRTTKGRLLDSYDFIIVGGGSAGSTLANRLSEINEWKVLLIEAGGQENEFTKTPAMFAAFPGTSFDWNYTTTPQKRTCQATGGQCAYPRGKVLGGSSSTNALIYTRGYRSDYDKWGFDNCGWSFQDLEPYFLQSEGNTIPGLLHHGRRGPLTVSYPPYKTSLRDDILQAGLVKGWRYADCPDYEDDCIYLTQMTMRKGRRCSASTAYLKPISNKRPNLHIITNTYVTKVIVENRVATGVEITREGTKSKVFASKEVILSAGSINSPQILMLSGIGPRDHLQSLGIPVIADLPVGDNLQDHNRVTLKFKVKNGSVPNIETLADPEIQEQYVENKKGPYSTTGIELLAFVRRGSESESREPPNVQHHITTLVGEEEYIAAIATTNLRPRSRGTVRLKSTDPLDAPLIDTNYYGDLYDWNITLEGMRHAHELFHTKPLRSQVVGLSKTTQPLCANEEDLEDFFNCLIKYYTITMYHPVGTVKMGTRKQNGVVNSNLQVYGIRRLRVIDASIPPSAISMNTNAMAIVIGEKGADLIKATYHKVTLQKPKICTIFETLIHDIFGNFMRK